MEIVFIFKNNNKVNLFFRSIELIYIELCEKSIQKWKEWNKIFPEEVYHEVGILNLWFL